MCPRPSSALSAALST
ncbi:hypothetical protein VCCP10303_2406, partial [Vibrio cholerae CP1030(3)]